MVFICVIKLVVFVVFCKSGNVLSVLMLIRKVVGVVIGIFGKKVCIMFGGIGNVLGKVVFF